MVGVPGGHRGGGGERVARGGKKGTVCRAPREGLRTGGGHRGALREEGDVDGASGGRRQRSPGTWLREVSASNRCPGALVGAGRLGGVCGPHAEAEGVRRTGRLVCLGASLAGSP